MLKACGKEYKFFPKTFMLPADYTALKQEFKDGKNHGNKTFIVKPSKGCQGTGIRSVAAAGAARGVHRAWPDVRGCCPTGRARTPWGDAERAKLAAAPTPFLAS